MTKSVARRVIAGGRKARVFSQTVPTNLKSLPHKPTTGAEPGAGSFIYRHVDVQRTTDFQRDGFTSGY